MRMNETTPDRGRSTHRTRAAPRDQARSASACEHAVDLVERVVVAEPDPDRPAGREQPEPREHLDRVVVPVPHADAAVRERRGGVERVPVAEPDRERRGALVHARRVGDPVHAAAPGSRRRPPGTGSRARARARANRANPRDGPPRGGRDPGVRRRCSRSPRSCPPSPRGDWVPVSQRCGSTSSAASSLYGAQPAEELAADAHHALVRAEELVRRGGHDVGAPAVQVRRVVLGEVDAVDGDERADVFRQPRRPRPPAASTPRRWTRAVQATSLVRGVIASASEPRSRVTSSSRTSAQRTVAPASRAASTHGRMFASWSRRVTTISSPGPNVRPNERDRWSRIDVAFWPNTTSSASHPSRSAPAACACVDQRVDVAARGERAVGVRRARAHASGDGVDHRVGRLRAAGRVGPARTAVRPGPVRASAGNRARTASTSSAATAGSTRHTVPDATEAPPRGRLSACDRARTLRGRGVELRAQAARPSGLRAASAGPRTARPRRARRTAP